MEKKKLLFWLNTLLFCVVTSQASNFEEEAQQRMLEKEKLIQAFKEDSKNTSYVKENSKSQCLLQSFKKDSSEKDQETQTPLKQNSDIILFVSFSMSDSNLKGYFDQLAFHPNVRVVIRGLVNDSMQSTIQKIQDLDGVVDVDPEAFLKYDIKRVPAFVLLKEGEMQAKLSGNITISHAKILFKEKGFE